jgi:pyruvate-formate lyase-activating enzyme
MKALVVNCSAPHYNLGAAKLADWLRSQGYAVEEAAGDPGLFAGEPDVVALSVIFSWHAPVARDIALRFADRDVWCGGPGMLDLQKWWKAETGLDAVPGLDPRFERQRGAYRMTFAARGCPVACWFCNVWRLEGRNFTLDWDFAPAPILCDNNLSALPDAFQDHILNRYTETGMKLADCNSGFEPGTFTEATYERWRSHYKGAWRFAFDEMSEEAAVVRMLGILKGESPRRKRVYVLVGNESPEECQYRAQRVIALGGEPHCQYVLPLNWLGDPAKLFHKHGWRSYQHGRDFCRYYNTRGWRTYPLSVYKPRVNEPPPFAQLAGAA